MALKDRFLYRFVKLYNAIHEEGRPVIVKTRYVEKYGGETFTITIEKGDKLNK